MNKKTQSMDALMTQMLALTDKDFKAATIKWATKAVLKQKISLNNK